MPRATLSISASSEASMLSARSRSRSCGLAGGPGIVPDRDAAVRSFAACVISGFSPSAGRPLGPEPGPGVPPASVSIAGDDGGLEIGPLLSCDGTTRARACSTRSAGAIGRTKKPSASGRSRGSSAASPTKKIGTRPRGVARTLASATLGSELTICGAITIRSGRVAEIQPDRLSPGSMATVSKPADTAARRI